MLIITRIAQSFGGKNENRDNIFIGEKNEMTCRKPLFI